jgi:hypothetical protein
MREQELTNKDLREVIAPQTEIEILSYQDILC